jgi:hypothetical protein
MQEAAVIINDVVSAGLKYIYTDFGVEGTASGDPVGLFDYFAGTPGTPYEATGLPTKGFTPDGMSLADLSNRCLDILTGEVS